MNDMFKWTLLFIVLFYKLITSYSQQFSLPFIWAGDSINGNYFEKTAMFIPIQSDNETYYFQFDTGANKSSLYKDTNRLLNVSIEINGIEFIQSTSNYIYTVNGHDVIGTLGADYIQNKIIEIDYINQRINILEAYDTSNYVLQPISLSYGRPVLELSIKHRNYPFIFDTGSSIFEVWTTKRLWKKWRNKTFPSNEYSISSWGKMNYTYQSRFRDSIYLMDKTILMDELWYNSNKQFNKIMKQAGVSGFIGNKPFYNRVIIIDLRNNLFGVKKIPKTP